MRAARGSSLHVVGPALLGAVVLVALALGEAVYWPLLTEDGPVEWAQFAGYAAAAWWFGRRARGRRALLPLLFAAGFVLVAGEEVAWGQRLLDLRVDAVQEVNRQGELTLHNLDGGLRLSWIAFAVLAGLGAFGHRLARRLPSVAGVAPPAALRWWFLPAAVYGGARLLVDDPTYAFAKAGEGFELCVAIGFAITARSLAPSGSEPRAVVQPLG